MKSQINFFSNNPTFFCLENSDLEKSSLLNSVGCVVTWVTWVRLLRGSVGVWVALDNFYVGYVGQIYLFFTWVKYTFIGCVGQIYF